MLHCAFIFEDGQILNTAIWSLDIVFYDRKKLKKKMYNGQIIKGDQLKIQRNFHKKIKHPVILKKNIFQFFY